jgi:deoxycytidine triphosphate deaminase
MANKKTKLPDSELGEDVCNYTGIIRDEELRAAIDRNLLLTKDSTDPSRVRQASYELRLSNRVEFLRLSEAPGAATARYERPANGIGEKLEIPPGTTAKVFVKEVFNLPTNVVAHVIPVGNIYKLGLSPETTYGDPGFDGEFYIILCNYSSRIVEVRVGDPVARVEFIKLARKTTKPHPGANDTSEPQLWPRRVERRPHEQLASVGVDAILSELEGYDPPHFEHAFVAREVRARAMDLAKELEQVRADLNLVRAIRTWAPRLGWSLLFLAVVSVGVWLAGWYWSSIPEKFRLGLADGFGRIVGGAVMGGVFFVVKYGWRKWRRGKASGTRGAR